MGFMDDDGHSLLKAGLPPYSPDTIRRAFIVWVHCGQTNNFSSVCNYYHYLQLMEEQLPPEARTASRSLEEELFTGLPPSTPFLRRLFPGLYSDASTNDNNDRAFDILKEEVQAKSELTREPQSETMREAMEKFDKMKDMFEAYETARVKKLMNDALMQQPSTSRGVVGDRLVRPTPIYRSAPAPQNLAVGTMPSSSSSAYPSRYGLQNRATAGFGMSRQAVSNVRMTEYISNFNYSSTFERNGLPSYTYSNTDQLLNSQGYLINNGLMPNNNFTSFLNRSQYMQYPGVAAVGPNYYAYNYPMANRVNVINAHDLERTLTRNPSVIQRPVNPPEGSRGTTRQEIVDVSQVIKAYCSSRSVSLNKFAKQFTEFAEKSKVRHSVHEVNIYIKRKLIHEELQLVFTFRSRSSMFDFLNYDDYEEEYTVSSETESVSTEIASTTGDVEDIESDTDLESDIHQVQDSDNSDDSDGTGRNVQFFSPLTVLMRPDIGVANGMNINNDDDSDSDYIIADSDDSDDTSCEDTDGEIADNDDLFQTALMEKLDRQ